MRFAPLQSLDMPPAAQSCCTAAQSLDEPDGLAEGLAEGLTDVLGPPQPVMSAAKIPRPTKNFMATPYYFGGLDGKHGTFMQRSCQGGYCWGGRARAPGPLLIGAVVVVLSTVRHGRLAIGHIRKVDIREVGAAQVDVIEVYAA